MGCPTEYHGWALLSRMVSKMLKHDPSTLTKSNDWLYWPWLPGSAASFPLVSPHHHGHQVQWRLAWIQKPLLNFWFQLCCGACECGCVTLRLQTPYVACNFWNGIARHRWFGLCRSKSCRVGHQNFSKRRWNVRLFHLALSVRIVVSQQWRGFHDPTGGLGQKKAMLVFRLFQRLRLLYHLQFVVPVYGYMYV